MLVQVVWVRCTTVSTGNEGDTTGALEVARDGTLRLSKALRVKRRVVVVDCGVLDPYPCLHTMCRSKQSASAARRRARRCRQASKKMQNRAEDTEQARRAPRS